MPPHPPSAQLPLNRDSSPSTLSHPLTLSNPLSLLLAMGELPSPSTIEAPRPGRRIAGARRRRAAPPQPHLLGASPSFFLISIPFFKLQARGRARASPNPPHHLQGPTGVALVAGKLIPIPDPSPLPYVGAIRAPLTIDDLELSNLNACWF